MKKEVYFTIVFMLIALLTLSTIIAEDIRPANQREDNGIGVQVRPANQMNLPSNGNGGYVPTQGSSYNSGYTVPLSAQLKPINKTNLTIVNGTNITTEKISNATGNAKFVVNKASNTLSYDVQYSQLSSNETGASINGPALVNQNAATLLFLPLGINKIGIIHYADAIEKYLLSGQTYLNIKSLLFPNGEIRGQIIQA